MKDLSWSDARQDPQEFWNERAQRFDAIADCNQHDDRERKICAILLIFQVSVPGHQDIEPSGCAAEQLTVSGSCPSGLLYCSCLVTGQVPT